MGTEIKCSAGVAGTHGADVEVVGAAHLGTAAVTIRGHQRYQIRDLNGQLLKTTLPKMDWTNNCQGENGGTTAQTRHVSAGHQTAERNS